MLNNNKNSLYIGIAVLAISLNSCIATKKYIEPEVESKYLFRLDSLVSNSEEEVSLEWEDFFEDQQLKKYIQLALEYNQDNSIALKNIELFKARYQRSKLGYYPTVQLQGDVQRQDQSQNTQFGSFANGVMTQYGAAVNASWELDLWGKIHSQNLAASAQFQQSITAQKLVKTQLISNVAKGYYDLIEADQRKLILETALHVRRQSLETMQELKNAGLENELSVSQAKAQLSQAVVLLNDTKYRIKELESAMVMLIGESQKDLKRNNNLYTSLDNPKRNIPSINANQLNNRPDVRVAELEFRAKFENHNVATASLYPSLKLTSNVGYQSLEVSSWFRPESFFNTIIGGITMPLINGKSLRTQKKVAKIEMEQSLLKFHKTVLSASVEVGNTLNKIEIQQQNLQELKDQEKVLDRSFEDSKELLKSGLVNYLNVLNAQDNLLNAQLSYNRLKAAYHKTFADLFRTIGGGQ